MNQIFVALFTFFALILHLKFTYGGGNFGIFVMKIACFPMKPWIWDWHWKDVDAF